MNSFKFSSNTWKSASCSVKPCCPGKDSFFQDNTVQRRKFKKGKSVLTDIFILSPIPSSVSTRTSFLASFTSETKLSQTAKREITLFLVNLRVLT